MDKPLDAEIAAECVDKLERQGFWLYDDRLRDKIGPLVNYVDWINLAAAVRRMNKAPVQDVTGEIAAQLSIALKGLEADPQLLGIIGSWRDTMTDQEVLDD